MMDICYKKKRECQTKANVQHAGANKAKTLGNIILVHINVNIAMLMPVKN